MLNETNKTTTRFVVDFLAKFLYIKRGVAIKFWKNILLLDNLLSSEVDNGILKLHEVNLGLPDDVFPIFDDVFTRLQVVKLKKFLLSQSTIVGSQTAINKVAQILLGVDNVKIVRLSPEKGGFDAPFDIPLNFVGGDSVVNLEVYLPQEFNTNNQSLDYTLDFVIKDGFNVSLVIFDKYLRYIMPFEQTIFINYKFFD